MAAVNPIVENAGMSVVVDNDIAGESQHIDVPTEEEEGEDDMEADVSVDIESMRDRNEVENLNNMVRQPFFGVARESVPDSLVVSLATGLVVYAMYLLSIAAKFNPLLIPAGPPPM